MSLLPRAPKKLLVANRNEIAIRVFRAATELGLRTVAIYAQEDRLSIHRFKADEAYLIGEDKGPVGAYLDIPGIIALAKEKQSGSDSSRLRFSGRERRFARACAEAGITFVGPRPEIIDLMGDKVAARALARKVGVPTLPGTEEPVTDRAAALKIAQEIGFPADYQGGFRRRRTRHEGGPSRRPIWPRCWTRRKAKPAAPSAIRPFFWRSTSRAPSTSKCRFWATATATCSICMNAIVRCSAATRKSSKSPRPSRLADARAARIVPGRRAAGARGQV